ncbi:MAG: antibiotic biosynthesis monooxygenase [Sebaldella sp.]|nr:antibiotic biosynthesis monooxygenase [Sebaldella sp.]
MGNKNLINRISSEDLKNAYYCTACIKVTEGNSYDEVYNELTSYLVKHTITEEGCIEFFVTPSNPKKGEFILWEIWKNKDAFNFHHSAEHTKNYFGKKLTEVKWIETGEDGNVLDI